MVKWLSGTIFALTLALLPASAMAQSTSTRVAKAEVLSRDLFPDSNVSGRVHTANIATCRTMVADNVDLRLKWTLKTAFSDTSLLYALKAQRPGQTCSTASADIENDEQCVVLELNKAIGSGNEFSFDVNARTLLGISDPAECEGRTENYDVIFVLPFVPLTGSGDTKTHEPDALRIRLETVRPNAPGEVSVTSGQSSLYVEWSAPSAADGYQVYVSNTPFAEGDIPEDVDARRHNVSSGTSLRVTSGIQANQVYYVGVTTLDKAGNESLISPIATVSTEPTIDFWEDYLNNGGRETGGYCQSMPASEGGILALMLGLGLLWRRSSGRQVGSDA